MCVIRFASPGAVCAGAGCDGRRRIWAGGRKAEPPPSHVAHQMLQQAHPALQEECKSRLYMLAACKTTNFVVSHGTTFLALQVKYIVLVRPSALMSSMLVLLRPFTSIKAARKIRKVR